MEQSDLERDSYENLILLCPNHHTLIDKPENENFYTVDNLHEMKNAHESDVLSKLESKQLGDIEELKDQVSVYLAENHQAWKQYGPTSDNARRNPNNNEIYALWTSERLSTIVPNNRKMAELLNENRSFFSRNEQRLVSEF